MKKVIAVLLILAVAGCILFRDEIPSQDDSLSAARDPGVRGGAAGAGAPIAGLSATELALFNAGKDDFEEQEKAADGLGPTMNLDGCAGCHLHPAVGGTSPAVNPQVAFARANGATRKKDFRIQGRPNIGLAGHAISGQANNNGNDGTVARFGWKAQNKSLLLFSGEAYNVEMGITNELFQTERDETAGCQFAAVPNDTTKSVAKTLVEGLSAIEKFALFARFLAPPAPSLDAPGGIESIARGRRLFAAIGCALCHTPTLNTGNAAVAALRNQPVNLFSDLLVHAMGPAGPRVVAVHAGGVLHWTPNVLQICRSCPIH